MVNLLHIAEGWAKSFGLMGIDAENKILAEARLKICAVCPEAKESKALEIIKGSMERVDIIYCNKCTCPCHEAALVTNKHCPLNKW